MWGLMRILSPSPLPHLPLYDMPMLTPLSWYRQFSLLITNVKCSDDWAVMIEGSTHQNYSSLVAFQLGASYYAVIIITSAISNTVLITVQPHMSQMNNAATAVTRGPPTQPSIQEKHFADFLQTPFMFLWGCSLRITVSGKYCDVCFSFPGLIFCGMTMQSSITI